MPNAMLHIFSHIYNIWRRLQNSFHVSGSYCSAQVTTRSFFYLFYFHVCSGMKKWRGERRKTPAGKCRNCVTFIARTSLGPRDSDGVTGGQGGTGESEAKRYFRRCGTENVSDLTNCFLSTRCQHLGSVSKQTRKEKPARFHHLKTQTPQ